MSKRIKIYAALLALGLLAAGRGRECEQCERGEQGFHKL